MSLICEYCNKSFKTKGNLKTHIENARYCLNLRNENLNDSNQCEFCNKKFSSKSRLDLHRSKCRSKDLHYRFQELQNKYNESLRLWEEKLKSKDEQLKKTEEKMNDLQNQIIELLASNIDKPTNITFNNNNNNSTNKIIDNRVLNMVPFTLTQEEIQKTLEEKFTENHLYNGQKGLAQFCVDNILTKEEDKLMMKCTDPSRKIFIYLDRDGRICKDINASRFTNIIYEPAVNVSNKIYNRIPDLHPGELDRQDHSLNKFLEIVNIKRDNNEFVKNLIPDLSKS